MRTLLQLQTILSDVITFLLSSFYDFTHTVADSYGVARWFLPTPLILASRWRNVCLEVKLVLTVTGVVTEFTPRDVGKLSGVVVLQLEAPCLLLPHQLFPHL